MKKPGGDIKKTTQWLEKNFLSKGLCLDSFFGTEKVDYFFIHNQIKIKYVESTEITWFFFFLHLFTTYLFIKSNQVNEASGVPLFRDKDPLSIIALYPKDSLTKSGSGRMSHLQKILLWVDVVSV